jgi:hypothetical protein
MLSKQKIFGHLSEQICVPLNKKIFPFPKQEERIEKPDFRIQEPGTKTGDQNPSF